MPSKKAKKKRGTIFSLTKKDCNWLKKITLMVGAGREADEANHRVCVMQAVSALTDGRREGSGFSDEPICVSDVICGYMISLNDSISSDRTRGRLKSLIPHILNTAPLVWEESEHWVPDDSLDGGHYQTRYVEVQDHGNRKYLDAERKRVAILDHVPSNDENIPLRTKLEAVHKAADLFRTGTSEVCDS